MVSRSVEEEVREDFSKELFLEREEEPWAKRRKEGREGREARWTSKAN